jgi:uncharacterized membrane protein
MVAVLGRQFLAAQQLVRGCAARNPNVLIEEQATTGDHIADDAARFGGPGGLFGYQYFAGKSAWDPYPFRQNEKDRVRGELDFDVNRRAEAEIQLLAQKLRAVDEKIGDADLLAEKLARVSG